MADLKRTPLFDLHASLGARMVDFAGWEMPVQYRGIVEEHRATREAAALFDVSHMGEALVEGPQAEAFLDRVMTNDVSKTEPGKALYTLMCYEDGGVVDDLIVYRLEPQRFLLCLNASNTAKDLEWLRRHGSGLEATVEDVSERYALLAAQGPKALEILAELGGEPLAQTPFFRFREAELGGVSCLASRTGYTGEPGMELFAPAEGAEALAKALLEAGEPYGLVPAGLGARDSLRLEAGLPLYGHEISETITPAQAGLMWAVKLRKPSDFLGREALAREKREGPRRRVVHFRAGTRRIARAGTAVLGGGKPVGEVLSGSFSPMLGEGIGTALVQADWARGRELEVDMRGKSAPIALVRPPFVPLAPQS